MAATRIDGKMQDLNTQHINEEKLYKGCLAAASAVTSALLKHESVEQLVGDLLDILVRETCATQAYWIKPGRDGSETEFNVLRDESEDHNPGPTIENLSLNTLKSDQCPAKWMNMFSGGYRISGRRNDFDRTEQKFIDRLGVQTVCFMPVRVNETLHGVIGLGYGTHGCPLPEPENALLRVSADTLTFAFAHRTSQMDKARLEQQIQHSQKMESLGELSSGISHNFRNILAGIIANCQLVQMKYYDHKDMLKSISGILHLAEIGSELVNKLLKFSRKGEKEQKSVYNLADILDETYQIISTSFDKKIDIRKSWDTALPIEGVRSELGQLIMNLCTNARDAMPDGGILQISAREERVKERIYLSISDTGSGMSDAVRKRIFDPFFTTKEPGKGTGLGLSTAYGIVKDHGGEIHLTSTPGVGTIFQILLPMARARGYEQEKLMEPINQGNGEVILVVDDDVALLETVKEMLDRIGYHTETAANGKQGIEKYFTSRPDVVLIDRNMPEIDGITAANQILQADPGAKIIIVSGYEDEGPDGIDGLVKEAIKAYIIKPFNISELSHMLTGVIGG